MLPCHSRPSGNVTNKVLLLQYAYSDVIGNVTNMISNHKNKFLSKSIQENKLTVTASM